MAKFIFGEAIGEVLRASHFVEARNIRGGTITAQELVIAGGTQGVIRSQNYDPTTGVGWAIFGDGSATFGGDVTIEGDLLGNWDGTVPVDLSGGQDTGATTGYAIDASEGNVQFLGSVFASGISFLDASNSNTQVGAIGGSNDELLINNVGSKDMRLQTLTGGDIKLQPGSGGTVSLNDGSVDRFTFSVVSGAPYLEFRPVDLTTPGFIQMVATNIGGGDIGTISIQPPYDSNPAELTIFNAASGDGGSRVSMSSFDYITVPEVRGPTGSQGSPSYTFDNDQDTGIYNGEGNEIWFSTGGTAQARFDGALGQFLVQNTGAQSRPEIGFWDDTDTGIMLQTTGQGLIVAAGQASIEWHSNNVYLWGARSNTTGSAANTLIQAADGRIFRSTSLRAHKSRITYNVDYLADIELKPAKFYRKDDKKWWYGFIAEDIVEQDPLLGEYDFETKELTGYDLREVVAVLAAKVMRLEKKLAALS